jgi:L-histidine Nalpha-methyltransferase
VNHNSEAHAFPVRIKNYLPEKGIEEIRQEIIGRLLAPSMHIPSKYFYNREGSRLFKDITGLEEYYLSRTEKAILSDNLPFLARNSRFGCVVELGNGDCSKISLLFGSMTAEKLRDIKYVPVDISATAIDGSVKVLQERFRELQIEGVVADFMTQLQHIPVSDHPALFCFFGSTIGNFDPGQRREFFNRIGVTMQKDDVLLLGVDMVKDVSVIENAYNDKQGVTASFNKNILNSVNYFLHSDFDTRQFQHLAFYSEKFERIEMHLKALQDMEITSPFFEKPVLIKKGKTIHTENSYKFRKEEFIDLSGEAGLTIDEIWTDRNNWFSVFQFRKKIISRLE